MSSFGKIREYATCIIPSAYLVLVASFLVHVFRLCTCSEYIRAIGAPRPGPGLCHGPSTTSWSSRRPKTQGWGGGATAPKILHPANPRGRWVLFLNLPSFDNHHKTRLFLKGPKQRPGRGRGEPTDFLPEGPYKGDALASALTARLGQDLTLLRGNSRKSWPWRTRKRQEQRRGAGRPLSRGALARVLRTCLLRIRHDHEILQGPCSYKDQALIKANRTVRFALTARLGQGLTFGRDHQAKVMAVADAKDTRLEKRSQSPPGSRGVAPLLRPCTLGIPRHGHDLLLNVHPKVRQVPAKVNRTDARPGARKHGLVLGGLGGMRAACRSGRERL